MSIERVSICEFEGGLVSRPDGFLVYYEDHERQVKELQKYKPLSLREYEMQTKLDTAMGLLREVGMPGTIWQRRVNEFLNTTSTEGKDSPTDGNHD